MDFLQHTFYMLSDEELRLRNISGIADIIDQRIYKYVGLEDAIKYILIEKNTLKFSHPNDFNDPFDCYEGFINFSNVPSFFINEEKVAKQLNPSITKETISKTIAILRNSNERNKFFRETKNKYKISCFSKTYDNVLMWSHYANKNSGVCIGFEFPIEPLPKDFIICPVIYKDVVVPFDAYANPHRIIFHWLLTKSHHWEYEQEVRAIIKENSRKLSADGIYEIEKGWIKEIIFGCKVSTKEVEKTIRLIRKNGYKNILIKKMSINPNNFSLKEDTIADIQNYKNKVK